MTLKSNIRVIFSLQKLHSGILFLSVRTLCITVNMENMQEGLVYYAHSWDILDASGAI